MAKKPDITTIASGYYSRQALNTNFENLQDGFDNTLSLDGSTPNSMGADLDMNSKDLLNAGEVDTSSLRINGVLVSSATGVVTGAVASSNKFTGDGSTTAYTLSSDPFIKDNTQVYIDGVYQNKITYNISGTTLTFTTAPPLNSQIEVMIATTLTNVGTAAASAVTYNQGGTGAVDTTAQVKLQESVSPKDFGAVADGSTNNTTALNNFVTAAANGFIPTGNFAHTGSLNALDLPELFTATSGSQIGGTKIPLLNVSSVAPSEWPDNLVYVRQDTSKRNSSVCTRVDRIVDSDDSLTNPKALRVYTKVNTNTAQTEWAISGELDNYSNTSSTGNTAVSGVSNKYGTASVFGGHFQAKDWVKVSAATDVTSLLGVEINTPSVGADHPSANALGTAATSLGRRRCVDLIARTNESVSGWDTASGNYGDAEIGVGLQIRQDTSTDGTFRYGQVINEVVANSNTIGTGLLVSTTGNYGIDISENTSKSGSVGIGLRIKSSGTAGLRIENSRGGDPLTNAIHLDTGIGIAFDTAGNHKIKYNGGTDSLEISDSGTERISFRLNATPSIEFSNTQVITTRRTGWAAASGTATRTTFATGSVTTAQLAERVKALIDDLTTHGLIGS